MYLEWPIIDQADFTEKCRDLYFCTTGYSPAQFIIVNIGLYYMFREQSFTLGEPEAAEYRRCSSMCRTNFEQSLERLHLLIAPSLEACQALVFGVIQILSFSFGRALVDIHRHFMQPNLLNQLYVYV